MPLIQNLRARSEKIEGTYCPPTTFHERWSEFVAKAHNHQQGLLVGGGSIGLAGIAMMLFDYLRARAPIVFFLTLYIFISWEVRRMLEDGRQRRKDLANASESSGVQAYDGCDRAGA